MKAICKFCENKILAQDWATFGKNKKPCHIECYTSVLDYARHYYNPITDFDGLNKELKNMLGLSATKEIIAEMLSFT